jgi:hypothetical protein
LVAVVVASGLVATLAHFTSLGDTLRGTAALGLLLIAIYTLLLGSVLGISNADRRALRLALRPTSASKLPDPSTG